MQRHCNLCLWPRNGVAQILVCFVVLLLLLPISSGNVISDIYPKLGVHIKNMAIYSGTIMRLNSHYSCRPLPGSDFASNRCDSPRHSAPMPPCIQMNCQPVQGSKEFRKFHRYIKFRSIQTKTQESIFSWSLFRNEAVGPTAQAMVPSSQRDWQRQFSGSLVTAQRLQPRHLSLHLKPWASVIQDSRVIISPGVLYHTFAM